MSTSSLKLKPRSELAQEQLLAIARDLKIKFPNSKNMTDLAQQLRAHAEQLTTASWQWLHVWQVEAEELVTAGKKALKQHATAAGTVHNSHGADKMLAHDASGRPKKLGGIYKKQNLGMQIIRSRGQGGFYSEQPVTRPLHTCRLYWVVTRNGELRAADRDNPLNSARGDGIVGWEYVLNEEVALQLLDGVFTVFHQPPQPTEQQIAAVRAIEKEIGAPPSSFNITRLRHHGR